MAGLPERAISSDRPRVVQSTGMCLHDASAALEKYILDDSLHGTMDKEVLLSIRLGLRDDKDSIGASNKGQAAMEVPRLMPDIASIPASPSPVATRAPSPSGYTLDGAETDSAVALELASRPRLSRDRGLIVAREPPKTLASSKASESAAMALGIESQAREGGQPALESVGGVNDEA